jgi:hypothetical protein
MFQASNSTVSPNKVAGLSPRSPILQFSKQLKVELPKTAVHETTEIQHILQHFKPGAWLVTDLDDTLMEVEQMLGSDQWFEAYMKMMFARYKDETDGVQRAVKETVDLYNQVHRHSKAKPVEEHTQLTLDSIHEKHPVVAITARGFEIHEATTRQLSSIGVDFKRGHFEDMSIWLTDDETIKAHHGVIYTSGTDKGKCFKSFVEKTAHKPECIIFVDDKLKHVEAMRRICEEMGIEFIGFHYTRLSHKVAALDLEVTNIQLEQFNNGAGVLLSDTEARELLNAKKANSANPGLRA